MRFDRNELAGAFGDLGVAIPLLSALILINKLDPASVLIVFGLLHVITGAHFDIPMPVQPLKVMSVIMITTSPPRELLYGAGLTVGILFLILAITNVITKIDDVIPKEVTRGVQFGLGLNLTLIALGYMTKGSAMVWALSTIGVIVTLALYNNRRVPPALILVLLGVAVSLATGLPVEKIAGGIGLSLPKFFVPSLENMLLGTLILALPQIPLSIGNSIIATSLLTSDLFPSRKASPRKLCSTYGIMNLIAPFLSGIPSCHGAGGLTGHYRFGGRTGGAVVAIGTIFIVIGLFFSGAVNEVLLVFPFPILGVLLFFSGFELMLVASDIAGERSQLFTALLVGLISAGVPYGYLIGMVAGVILHHLLKRRKLRV